MLTALAAVFLSANSPAAAKGSSGALVAIKASCEAALIPGLERSQSVITLDEFDFISALGRQPGVSDLAYLDKFGAVRWYKDPTKITVTYAQFMHEANRPTNAIPDAVGQKTPVAKPFAEDQPQDVAIPLVSLGKTVGILSFQATDQDLRSLVRFAGAYRKSKPHAAPASPKTKPPQGETPSDSVKQALQYYLSGLIFFDQGDFAQARAEWKLASLLDPDNEDARAGIQRLDKIEGEGGSGPGPARVRVKDERRRKDVIDIP